MKVPKEKEDILKAGDLDNNEVLKYYYKGFFSEEEKHRHDVRPGLTGLAQVCGRNNLDWDERFEKDIEYVNKITFINDTKIVIKTITSIVKRKDVEIPKESHDLDIIRRRKEEEKNECIDN